MSTPAEKAWNEVLVRLEQLRTERDGLMRQYLDLEKRHLGLVEYNNELFSEQAQFTGDVHRALGLADDADFLDHAEYIARIERLAAEEPLEVLRAWSRRWKTRAKHLRRLAVKQMARAVYP